jgi:hypothetical protein
MAIYVVMEAAVEPSSEGTRQAIFVRDRFSLLAFLFPVVWLLWHRLWIEALLALALTLCLASLAGALGLGTGAALALSLLVSLYVALEGSALKIAALGRRGWREWGVVRAGNRGEAEIRYVYEAGAEATPAAVPAAPARAKPWMQPRPSGPVIGLFDYPGGR